MSSEILTDLFAKMKDLDFEASIALTEQAIESGILANTILAEGLTKGMNAVGKLFEAKEYFLADLMTATYIMEKALDVIGEQLKAETGTSRTRGTVVFGTVEGDLHTIGKDITISLLRASGYEVYDLGIDVPAEAFVKKVKKVNPDIVAMSTLLLTTLPSVTRVVDELTREGLRDQVYIMIGGATTTQEFADKIGVDAYCATALDAVERANKCMEG